MADIAVTGTDNVIPLPTPGSDARSDAGGDDHPSPNTTPGPTTPGLVCGGALRWAWFDDRAAERVAARLAPASPATPAHVHARTTAERPGPAPAPTHPAGGTAA